MHFSHLILGAAAEAANAGGSGGVFSTLGLNWKLFLAQLVNFTIVLFILWRWVMKPVVGALESRRLRIEHSVRQAEEIERRMREFEKSREGQLAAARAEADKIMKKALATAEALHKETADAARAEADRLVAEAKTAIDREKQQMLEEIRSEVATLTVMATEKILREKLSSQKDKELIKDVMSSLK